MNKQRITFNFDIRYSVKRANRERRREMFERERERERERGSLICN